MGAYLRQKSDLLPPLERERNSVSQHVPSFYIKMSEGWFVWAAPSLLRGKPYSKNADNSLRGANNVGVLNPARVLSRESVARFIFQIFKYIGVVLSIDTDVLPVQINITLNREGVELPFNQSY
jgi:hypothetical protein